MCQQLSNFSRGDSSKIENGPITTRERDWTLFERPWERGWKLTTASGFTTRFWRNNRGWRNISSAKACFQCHISKQREESWKYDTQLGIIDELRGVWRSLWSNIWSWVFDISSTSFPGSSPTWAPSRGGPWERSWCILSSCQSKLNLRRIGLIKSQKSVLMMIIHPNKDTSGDDFHQSLNLMNYRWVGE